MPLPDEIARQLDESRASNLLGQARLFARIHRPDELIDGETYEVDLSAPSFEIVWGGQPVSQAHVQLIATYLPSSGEWLWSKDNTSINPAGRDALMAALVDDDRFAALRGLLEERTLDLSQREASDLATWIAYRAGFEAMYPSRVGDSGTTAFLALRFTHHRGQPATPRTTWCIGCGELPGEMSRKMMAGPGGRGICEGCAENPIAALEYNLMDDPDFLDRPPSVSTVSSMDDYVCAFCEERNHRIFMPETAICYPCVNLIRKALAAN